MQRGDNPNHPECDGKNCKHISCILIKMNANMAVVAEAVEWDKRDEERRRREAGSGPFVSMGVMPIRATKGRKEG